MGSTRLQILDLVHRGVIAPQVGRVLLAELARAGSGDEEAISPDRPSNRPCLDIAVIGMSGRFADAKNLDEFWTNLESARDSVREIPRSRWDVERYFDPDPLARDKTTCRWGSVLADVDEFDPDFFNMSPREARLTDPQHRLFLMEAWRAFEDAGYSPRRLDGSRCSVFVGCASGDYKNLLRDEQVPLEGYTFMGNDASILAARIAYCLNLRGPSMAIDTACSASLVAVHLACEALRDGHCDLALAGGVAILVTPELHVLASKAGMLSPRGKCRPFDDGADGFVPGEGVGALVLKRLDRALAEGDHVHGVIRASAVNQDGKTNGITAPSGPSQTSLEVETYRRFDIDPGEIGYVECHGTGTRLGDPIEIEALTKAFSEFTSKRRYCGIGSVKSNIGHALTAAGIAGLIKVLLCLREKKLVASLHFEKPNRHLRLDDGPFFVVAETRPWEGPRNAAVSSFGFSGTNAHLVVSEAPELPAAPEPADRWRVAAVSARTPGALSERLVDLRAWLQHHPVGSLRDVTFTLATGRMHWRERVAFVARSIDELTDRISGYLQGLPTSREGASPDAVAAADAYERGEPLPALLHEGERPRRVPLPTYPFARDRFWVPRVPEAKLPGTEQVPPTGRAAVCAEDEPARIAAHDELATRLYVPEWRLATPLELTAFPHANGHRREAKSSLREHTEAGAGRRVLIVSEPRLVRSDLALEIQRRHPRDQVVLASPEGAAGDPGDPDIVYLLAVSDQAFDPRSLELAERAETWVVSFFRLIKALDARGAARRALHVKVVTSDVLGVDRDEIVRPAAAALVGFTKSLAKERGRWKVTCLDVSSAESFGATRSQVADAVVAEPPSPTGEEVALRRGRRWVRRLRQATVAPADRPAFRDRGTYVILGGAGGIGLELGMHLARTARARLVLLGRSELDERRQRALDVMASLGAEPLYLRVDASDEAAMQEAIAAARNRFGAIHGAFHSAISLHDRLVENMDETTLLCALSPKIRASVVLARLLRAEPLDFFAFFSSAQSFTGNPGQSNYSAGCTFKDAFASALRHEGIPSTIVNWGYWGEVGIVATDDHRRRMLGLGVHSISPAEGMDALERLLVHRVPQAMPLKAEARVLGDFRVDAGGHASADDVVRLLEQLAEGSLSLDEAYQRLRLDHD